MLFALLASTALLRCDPLHAKNAIEPSVRTGWLRSSQLLEEPVSQRAPKPSVPHAPPARNECFPPPPMANVVSGEDRKGTRWRGTGTQARDSSSKDAAIRTTSNDSADPQPTITLQTLQIGRKILQSTAYETCDATSTHTRPAKARSTRHPPPAAAESHSSPLGARPTEADVRRFLTSMLDRPCGTARRRIRDNLQHRMERRLIARLIAEVFRRTPPPKRGGDPPRGGDVFDETVTCDETPDDPMTRRNLRPAQLLPPPALA